MNDEELLNKLYYKNLITSVNELYKQAKAAHPKITMKLVKNWFKNQSSTQLNNKPLKRIFINQSIQRVIMHFKLI